MPSFHGLICSTDRISEYMVYNMPLQVNAQCHGCFFAPPPTRLLISCARLRCASSPRRRCLHIGDALARLSSAHAAATALIFAALLLRLPRCHADRDIFTTPSMPLPLSLMPDAIRFYAVATRQEAYYAAAFDIGATPRFRCRLRLFFDYDVFHGATAQAFICSGFLRGDIVVVACYFSLLCLLRFSRWRY